ncbi:MFS transporter [Streptomyces sp. NPDC001601]|uniref:MFS transporter n=1 Tax=Streptomyces sp. NPDC001601 TaxID=3364592 RepID=UPI0036C8567F
MAAATTRWPRRTLFLSGLGLSVVGSLLIALVPNFGTALFARALAGVGGSMVTPTAVAAAAALAPAERRGRAISVVMAGQVGGDALVCRPGCGLVQGHGIGLELVRVVLHRHRRLSRFLRIKQIRCQRVHHSGGGSRPHWLGLISAVLIVLALIAAETAHNVIRRHTAHHAPTPHAESLPAS